MIITIPLKNEKKKEREREREKDKENPEREGGREIIEVENLYDSFFVTCT